MTLFYLYRLKIERSDKPSMFDDQTRQPGVVILLAIEEKPSQEIRKGQTWHIGNIFGTEAGLYFMASLTLRECWHVVMGSQLLILSRHQARKSED